MNEYLLLCRKKGIKLSWCFSFRDLFYLFINTNISVFKAPAFTLLNFHLQTTRCMNINWFYNGLKNCFDVSSDSIAKQMLLQDMNSKVFVLVEYTWSVFTNQSNVLVSLGGYLIWWYPILFNMRIRELETKLLTVSNCLITTPLKLTDDWGWNKNIIVSCK